MVSNHLSTGAGSCHSAVAMRAATSSWHNEARGGDEELSLAAAGADLHRSQAEAERTGVPATTLAREAVDSWLRQQFRRARHDAIAAYATEMAGTHLDLDAIWSRLESSTL